MNTYTYKQLESLPNETFVTVADMEAEVRSRAYAIEKHWIGVCDSRERAAAEAAREAIEKNSKPGISGWEEFVRKIKYNIEYGFHCNDLSFNDMEDDICFAIDKLAKENGLPPVDWEARDFEEENDD
jgi:hypothetical protein